jgi:hypothetical protein
LRKPPYSIYIWLDYIDVTTGPSWTQIWCVRGVIPKPPNVKCAKISSGVIVEDDHIAELSFFSDLSPNHLIFDLYSWAKKKMNVTN